MIFRTKVKICGLTRLEDVNAAIQAGADAIGFVFYKKSKRYIAPAMAAKLIVNLPPFVSIVGLFVNPSVEDVSVVLNSIQLSLLQFHGNETSQQCAFIANTVKLPFLRAMHIKDNTSPKNFLEFEQQYRTSSSLFRGLLFDTATKQYGGSGKVFNWSIIPKGLVYRFILSGGLNVNNITYALKFVHPYAVDVSSGVEKTPGIKDCIQITTFMNTVYLADIKRKRIE